MFLSTFFPIAKNNSKFLNYRLLKTNNDNNNKVTKKNYFFVGNLVVIIFEKRRLRRIGSTMQVVEMSKILLAIEDIENRRTGNS